MGRDRKRLDEEFAFWNGVNGLLLPGNRAPRNGQRHHAIVVLAGGCPVTQQAGRRGHRLVSIVNVIVNLLGSALFAVITSITLLGSEGKRNLTEIGGGEHVAMKAPCRGGHSARATASVITT